jgi:hypothetical protein
MAMRGLLHERADQIIDDEMISPYVGESIERIAQ